MIYKKKIILADRDDFRKVTNTIKYTWWRDVLIQTGMELDNCFPASDNPEDQTIEQKQLLRKILNENNILIIDEFDLGLKIYIEEELIAEWKKPTYTLKTDLAQLNPKKKLYIEIMIEYYSVFDQEIEEEN
jgi:hypothetical protein